MSHMDATYSERMLAFMSDTLSGFPMEIADSYDPIMAINQLAIAEQDRRECDVILNGFGDPARRDDRNFLNSKTNQGSE